MSTDIKLSKDQISKIFQSGGSFGSWLGNLGKKALTNFAIPLERDNFPGLVSNLTSNTINKYGKGRMWKMWKRDCQCRKKIYFIYFEWRYEWYYQNHKIIRRFMCIDWWSHWNSKTWNKKHEGGFLGALLVPLAAQLVQPVIYSVVKGILGRRVRRAERRYMDENIQFLSIF